MSVDLLQTVVAIWKLDWAENATIRSRQRV